MMQNDRSILDVYRKYQDERREKEDYKERLERLEHRYINLNHAFLGCKTIGPHFLKRKKGKVINITGIAARQGSARMTAYSSGKAGLARFTQALALEWAPYDILVNSIAPGAFPDTDLENEEFLKERTEWAKSNVPLGRIGDLKEVGYLAVYLISDASNYMTGQTIYLDGGLTYA